MCAYCAYIIYQIVEEIVPYIGIWRFDDDIKLGPDQNWC